MAGFSKFRYVLLVIISVISLGWGGLSQALAQTDTEPTGFKNVTLWVNPEYDDPRLLMMLEGKIVGASAPVRVRFLVPSAAEMYSAGSKDAQGKYSGGPPDRKASTIPGWDEISYELKTDTFRVEYYDPAIPSQPDKKIAYDFHTLYPISDLRVAIQQPRKATDFTVTPNGAVGTDSEGFAVRLYNYTNLDAGASLHFDIAYTRTDSKPSLSTNTAGSSTRPLIVGGTIAALAIIVFVVLQIKKNRPSPVPRSAGRTASRRNVKGRFCSQCGQPVTGQERFCAHCGNKLS